MQKSSDSDNPRPKIGEDTRYTDKVWQDKATGQ
jgi:hypothetical protein